MIDTAFIRSIREGLKQTRKPKETGTDELSQEYKEMTPGQTDEALDPVNKVAVKKKFKDRKDKDIDNDGDVDSSDKYLHKRRKAISKAMKEMAEEIEGLDERRRDYSNLIPFPDKVLTDFAKRAKKAGLDFDQYTKFVKGTFKDGADEGRAIIHGRDIFKEEVEIEENVILAEEVSVKDFDSLKKGDIITIDFKSAMSTGKSTFRVTAKNIVGKARVEKATLQSIKNPKGVKHFLYKRGNKVSFAQGDMGASVVKYAIEELEDEGYGGSKKRLKAKAVLKKKGYIHKKDRSSGWVEQTDEDAPANNTSGVDMTPHLKPKRGRKKVETEEFGGNKVFVVSSQRWHDSRLGKARYSRYDKYVGNDSIGNAIREYGRGNPKAPIILKNSQTGAMLYLKYGSKRK